MRSRPLPRALQLSIVLLATIGLAPLSAGAPLVPDVLHASGAATTFEVFGTGFTVEGAPYTWNEACVNCLIRITIGDGAFVVFDADGGTRALEPGRYELREYRGAFLFSQNAPHDFVVEFHGAGKIVKLE